MQAICGKIRNYDIDQRVFDMIYGNHVYFFRISRSLAKKFEPYLDEGVYISFRSVDEAKIIDNIKIYDVITVDKIYKHQGKKLITYFDINEIKDGVRKVINKDSYKLFIDLEFTMPPYNIQNKNEFYSEIVEYGMCVEDPTGALVDVAYGMIKPKCKYGVSDRLIDFLHVDKKEIEHAPYYNKFYDTLKDFMMYYQPTIYVWGKNDILMIDSSYKSNKMSPLTSRKDFVNLMQVMKTYYSIKNDIGLYNAFELFGVNPPMRVQDHNALHDAEATLEVFHLFSKEINN